MGIATKPVLIVQGAQYGSEGKGMVASALGHIRKVDYAVRTGAVNAGHTVYYKGKKYAMQQIPTGWTRPETKLVIGAGAYIHPEIFQNEINMVAEATGEGVPALMNRILIDYRAGLHLPVHTDRSTESGRHYKIGATGKGCSEAIVDKIRLRGSGGQLFREYIAGIEFPLKGRIQDQMLDTADLLNGAYDTGKQILLEGTQGTFLDLHLGPYPYTTHKQCTAGQWPVECGLSPSLEYEVVLAVRSYPIRVAGNSGPMPGEITWPMLAERINTRMWGLQMPNLVDPIAVALFTKAYRALEKKEYPSPEAKLSEQNRDAWLSLDEDARTELAKLFEFTTVTKKLRRIAILHTPTIRESVMLNRPSSIVLTFANYIFPETWGLQDMVQGSQPEQLTIYLEMMSNDLEVPVKWYTTGPEDCHFCWSRRDSR